MHHVGDWGLQVRIGCLSSGGCEPPGESWVLCISNNHEWVLGHRLCTHAWELTLPPPTYSLTYSTELLSRTQPRRLHLHFQSISSVFLKTLPLSDHCEEKGFFSYHGNEPQKVSYSQNLLPILPAE